MFSWMYNTHLQINRFKRKSLLSSWSVPTLPSQQVNIYPTAYAKN